MPGDVVADGRVDQEKLQELLSLGAEQEALDFKATLDLSDTKANLDFIKDMLAMMSLSEGGFLIVGVGNDGSLAHDQDAIDPRAFDSASLLGKVRAYTDTPVDVRSAVWEQEDEYGRRQVALVYAGPPPEMFPVIITRLGEIQLPDNRKKPILSPGQIVVREGPRSQPWHPDTGLDCSNDTEGTSRKTPAPTLTASSVESSNHWGLRVLQRLLLPISGWI